MNALNDYFRKAMSVLYKYGGEVIKFAGDAMICVFLPEDFPRPGANPETPGEAEAALARCAVRAAYCAEELARRLGTGERDGWRRCGVWCLCQCGAASNIAPRPRSLLLLAGQRGVLLLQEGPSCPGLRLVGGAMRPSPIALTRGALLRSQWRCSRLARWPSASSTPFPSCGP